MGKALIKSENTHCRKVSVWAGGVGLVSNRITFRTLVGAALMSDLPLLNRIDRINQHEHFENQAISNPNN